MNREPKFEISLMNRIEGIESIITNKGVTDTGKPDNLHMGSGSKRIRPKVGT